MGLWLPEQIFKKKNPCGLVKVGLEEATCSLVFPEVAGMEEGMVPKGWEQKIRM